MKKELGIFGLLVALMALAAVQAPNFLDVRNLQNVTALIGMYGIFSLGLGLIIITGGIDLSVGSYFAFMGVVFGKMLAGDWPWPVALLALLVGSLALGLVHGTLITRGKLQPFVVTLCGLLIYRGLARFFADDSSVSISSEAPPWLRWIQNGKLPADPLNAKPLALYLLLIVLAGAAALLFSRAGRRGTDAPKQEGRGLAVAVTVAAAALVALLFVIRFVPSTIAGLQASLPSPARIDLTNLNFGTLLPTIGANAAEAVRLLAIGKFQVPMPLVWLVLIAVAVGVLLHGSIYGRYLYAVGRNEEATRYSGVNTRRVIGASYVLSAGLAMVSGVLFALYSDSITPTTHGNAYELFGIAAAVLGGCSLRGGEGSVVGIVLGTALIQVLYNTITFLGYASSLADAIMGAVILFGAAADVLLAQRTKRAKLAPPTAGATPGDRGAGLDQTPPPNNGPPRPAATVG